MTDTTNMPPGPAPASAPSNEPKTSGDFIRTLVAEDLRAGKNGGRVATRFPPEPNGYLHIGHAKSICLNFGVAREFGGTCNLRFDDTNPAKEEIEYVESIEDDVRWLGFQWNGLFYASDYFEQLHGFAVELVKKGKAYVDDLTADQIREYRGTLTQPGKNSPFRDRSVAENLDLFEKMRAGTFDEGSRVLRAKIDMASPNICMRDPTMYRIKKSPHHRTGDKWLIYPMYDFAHCISDALEGITHSICTLEFANNRELYDWFLDNITSPSRPRQYEFARLNLNYTVLSKRKLLQLVTEGHVRGWDDPRMPTIRGLRRRGYTPEAMRNFAERVGVAKADSVVDLGMLEHAIREDLNVRAPRVMAVLRPLEVVIENYPEDKVEEFEVQVNPEDPTRGMREVPFSRILYIEQDDFREVPPPKYFRLSPGKEVRLRGAYFIRCTRVVKDEATGQPVKLYCTYDPASRGGASPDGRKVKATIHWVSARHAIEAEVRLYDHLFKTRDPMEGAEDPLDNLNPASLEVLTACKLEPSLATATADQRYQFERLGYFCPDAVDSKPGALVFNRTVTLRDAWAKIEQKSQRGASSP